MCWSSAAVRYATLRPVSGSAKAIWPPAPLWPNDRADAVRFMEANAATARLLELLRDNDCATGAQLLAGLADEMDVPADTLLAHGDDQLRDLLQRSVVGVAPPAGSAVQKLP